MTDSENSATRWRPGVRLGVDVGTVRIGVAVCDPSGILATPLATVRRDAGAVGTRGDLPADVVEIRRLVREHNAVDVIVGLPITLAGTERQAAAAIREYSEILRVAIDPVPVRFADERMSTVVATRRLSDRGVRGRRQRAVIDQAAAVEILQNWLDARRRQT